MVQNSIDYLFVLQLFRWVLHLFFQIFGGISQQMLENFFEHVAGALKIKRGWICLILRADLTRPSLSAHLGRE